MHLRFYRIKTTILNSVTELIISENRIWSWIDESFNLFSSNFRCSCMSSAASLGILEWLESVGKPVYSSEFSLCTVTWGHTKSQTSLVDDILLSLMNKYWTWPQEIDPLLVKNSKLKFNRTCFRMHACTDYRFSYNAYSIWRYSIGLMYNGINLGSN